MKFNVGDKVRIIDNCTDDFDEEHLAHGKIGTIIFYDDEADLLGKYCIQLDSPLIYHIGSERFNCFYCHRNEESLKEIN